ncbi:hypothetical protein [Actinomyces ruminis]|uniref:hypothetical protein n=1 Tax=Actinomyces ruminis TaxID=1937003 RepID=UPI0030B8341F
MFLGSLGIHNFYLATPARRWPNSLLRCCLLGFWLWSRRSGAWSRASSFSPPPPAPSRGASTPRACR